MLTLDTFKVNLEGQSFNLVQTEPQHFDALYQVASDPELWVQHPQSDRWKPDVFKRFFDVGLQNPEGCFTIVDKGLARSWVQRAFMVSMRRNQVFGSDIPLSLDRFGGRSEPSD